MTKVTLVPLQYGSHSIEQILLLDYGLDPVTIFHIDLLWTDRLSEHREIHEKLSDGTTVECEVEFKILDKGE